MAGSRGKRGRAWARIAVALGAACVAALAACNKPSAGGPGLEPPGGESNGFSNGPGETMVPPTSGAGTGGGVPSVPGADPGNSGEPTAPGLDAGASGSDAGASDAGDATDASTTATSCDRRTLMCKSAEPVCPVGEVGEIVDGCFGACVPIDACACDAPEACPDSDHYTCHNFKMRCGPYL